MRTKIYPALRTDKKSKIDGTCPVYFIVRFNGVNIKFPAKINVHPKDWKGRKDNEYTKDIRKTLYLKKKVSEFESWVLERETNSKPVTEALIKEFFAGNDGKSFVAYYENKMKNDIAALEYNTKKGYRTNINALCKFRKNILFGDIDLKFIEDFDRFLSKKGLQSSGRYGHHKNLKAILNRAKKERLIKENPYEEDFKMPKVAPRTEWLREEEVRRIEELVIPDKNPGLIRTRYLFLFACYTGLRYCDVVSLEWKNLHTEDGRWLIEKVQVKTKNKVIVPLSKKAFDIINLFRNENAKYVFGSVSNQKLNYNLKKIMAMAGIDKRVTFHIARHTFASITATNGGNLYMLSEILGHRSLRMTERYAKLNTSALFGVVDIMGGKKADAPSKTKKRPHVKVPV